MLTEDNYHVAWYDSDYFCQSRCEGHLEVLLDK